MCDRDRRGVRRRGFLGRVAAGGLAAGTSGCQFVHSDAGRESGTPLEVLHDWIGGDRAAAMESLVAAFERAAPETSLDERPVADVGAMELAETRIENDDPPGTFLARLGGALARYGDDLGDVGERVWDADLRDAHLPAAREACRAADGLAGVPLGAFRVNELFYDPAVLDAAGVDPTELSGVGDLVAACERVAERTDAVPFAHALRGSWTTTQLLATVLLSDAGPQAYRRWTRGVDATRALERTVSLTRSVLDWTSADASDWTLTDSTRLLADGDAAFVQQGSWAGSDLTADAGAFGSDWNRIPFPGTRGQFAFDLFGFVVPVDAPAPEAGRQWLRFLGRRDGQRAANAPGQSVPTRTDVDPEAFGEYQRVLYADLDAARDRVPSVTHGDALSPEETEAVHDAVERHVLGESDPAAAASALVDAVR